MSKKTIVGVIAVVLIVIVGFFVMTTMNDQTAPVAEVPTDQTPSELPNQEVVLQLYTLPGEGLQFEYPGGENGFTATELPLATEETQLVRVIRLLPTVDYVAEQNRKGGEGSPAWLLRIYNNDQDLLPAKWAETFPVASNIELALADPTETVVGGADAVTYRIDGLYPTQVYVIANADFIYLVQVSFLDETAATYRLHQAWLSSFLFTPTTPVVNGKLDPRVACESALAYTTFDSGAAAEVFVADCVAGKHPEVIERYKADMGLDGAAI